MSSDLFKNVISKICLQIIALIHIYKQDLVLNNLQWLICLKTHPTKLNLCHAITFILVPPLSCYYFHLHPPHCHTNTFISFPLLSWYYFYFYSTFVKLFLSFLFLLLHANNFISVQHLSCYSFHFYSTFSYYYFHFPSSFFILLIFLLFNNFHTITFISFAPFPCY